MGAFWDGFYRGAEPEQLEKVAVIPWLSALHALGVAGGAHVGQNVIMRHLLGNKRFSRTAAKSFQEGISGKAPGKLRQFLTGMTSGATLPETAMLSDHARELGVHVADTLKQHGVSHLAPRDTVLGRALTRGDFSKLLNPRYFDGKSPAHQALLSAFNKKFGSNLTPDMLVAAQKSKSPAVLSHLRELEGTWKAKESPLTSNLISNITRNPGKAKGQARPMPVPENPHAAAPSHGARLAGGALGAAGAGVVEPGMALANASKIMMTNPAARAGLEKVPLGKRLLNWADKKFVNQPIESAVEAGKQGKTLSPFHKAVETYVFNPVTAEAANTGNLLSKTVASTPAGRLAASRPLAALPRLKPTGTT